MPVKLPVKEEQQVFDMVPTAGANNSSFLDKIPLPLVLALASPYLAGRSAESALKLAHKLYKNDRFTATLDILGEDAESPADCDASVEDYKQLIDKVSQAALPMASQEQQLTVSFKPSMFSVVAPSRNVVSNAALEEAYERIKKVVDHAKNRNVRVTLEAEDHRWTDFQLETYFSLIKEGYGNLGTVLQSRLFRTRNDIKRFDERMRVRMVIGIYNEPAEIAHTQKPIMKDLLVEFANELLHHGTYVEVATHDTACLDNFFRKAVIAQSAPTTQFETQFLLGVPRGKLQHSLTNGHHFHGWLAEYSGSQQEHVESLIRNGVLVRLYLPYGTARVAGPYCKRRLKANPNMIGYGIKNFLHIE